MQSLGMWAALWGLPCARLGNLPEFICSGRTTTPLNFP